MMPLVESGMAAAEILTWLTFAGIVAMIVAYALERWSIEVVSLAALVGWLVLFWAVPMLTGTRSPLGPDELLAGLSNQALITVLALIVVGQGLFHTDALEHPTNLLARLGGKTGMGAILVVLLAAMVVSAFVNDTPVVVMFLPIVTAIAAGRGIAASKALMPLSFAALLGGMTTLIGTSTNLLAAGVALKSGGLAIGFFDFTVPAGAMAIVGFAYVAFVLPRILKARTGMAEQITGGSGKQFIAQIEIGYGHPLAGTTAVAGMFPRLKDMTVRLVQRGEHPFLPPFENLTLQPGDTVIVAATRSALTRALSEGAASTPSPDAEGAATTIPTRDLTLAEAVVAPGARLIGRTIEQAAIHYDTGNVVLGVERRSRMPRMQLADIRLEAGDVLLLGGTQEAIEGLRANRDLLLLEWSASELPQRRYARRALDHLRPRRSLRRERHRAHRHRRACRGTRHGPRRLPQHPPGRPLLRSAHLPDDRRRPGRRLGPAGDRRRHHARQRCHRSGRRPARLGDPVDALPGRQPDDQRPVQQCHRGPLHAGRPWHRRQGRRPAAALRRGGHAGGELRLRHAGRLPDQPPGHGPRPLSFLGLCRRRPAAGRLDVDRLFDRRPLVLWCVRVI